jgi:hypothetical protein
MTCQNQLCRAENVNASKFCMKCGRRLGRGWRRYVKVTAVSITSIFLCFCVVAIVMIERPEQQRDQKRLEAQRAFEATPAGKKLKFDREAAERKAETDAAAGRLLQLTMASRLENEFLNDGFDIESTVDDGGALYITGPAVNRVFAHQFMRGRTVAKTLRSAGFSTVRFGNTKSGFSDDYLAEAYDLKP